jgi:2-dehydro-3-deoxyphosphogluconate aldolase / (4S)-4-hydroxy-2-oxoglutarate aldolase
LDGYKGLFSLKEVVESILKIGIIPVIKISDTGKALYLAKALCSGGLPCVELSFLTKQAGESIRRITKEFPQMLVGAGAVLTAENASAAVALGASFIVSSDLNPELIGYCVENRIPVIPDCKCPSDIERALSFGFDTVIISPSKAVGGIIRKNLSACLSFGKVISNGGGRINQIF